MNKDNISTPMMTAFIAAALLAAHWATDTLTIRMASLPVEGTLHATRAASITPDTKIYPLLAETQARTTSLEFANLEMAFTRALAPPVIAPPAPPEPPKPTAADIFKEHARVSAIAATGAFINGRYYHVGESINSKAKLMSVTGCVVHISVAGETVKLGSGNCKGS